MPHIRGNTEFLSLLILDYISHVLHTVVRDFKGGNFKGAYLNLVSYLVTPGAGGKKGGNGNALIIGRRGHMYGDVVLF